ncbi:MAG: lactonase family protein [Planctomycetes bacterium]|nr:lactonase family protein [Planctomycetota bacterium]
MHHGYLSTLASVLVLAFLGTFAADARGQAQPGNTNDPPPKRLLVYIGTYTNGASKGIYCYHLDLASGSLTPAGATGGVGSPSFLAIHPSRKFLYAVSERGDPAKGEAGGVSAFALNPASGELTPLNQQSSGGAGPCHLVVDSAGKNVLAANYGGGSVVVLPIAEDGSLREASTFIQHEGKSVHPQRQAGPHAHSINLDAANRFAVAADLGLDKVLVYRFDSAQGKLTPNDPPAAALSPGAGPRHFAFHPGGQFAYVINEMQSTLTAFSYDAKTGVLKDIQTISTLPPGFDGRNSTAEVQVHPSGKFLYGSNRGHDSLAIFAIDQGTGRLTAVGHQPTGGKTPRNFGIDPTGAYVLAANQGSDTVVVFRVDQQTGKLAPTGVKIDVPSPVCVKMISMDE